MANRTRTIVASSTEQTGTVRSLAAILIDIDADLILDNGNTCLWYGLQNKDGAASLYLQDNAAAGANDNVEIEPESYYQSPVVVFKYDLRDEFVRVGANNQVFSINIMWG